MYCKLNKFKMSVLTLKCFMIEEDGYVKGVKPVKKLHEKNS